MTKQYNVAVVGATGLVGEMMIRVLEERRFPVKRLKRLASTDSTGKVKIEALSKNSFEGIDFALFSAGTDVSKEFAPIAVKSGAVVIDNSSAFRMIDNVPLVVPEINGDLLTGFKGGIIANPNCSTIQMVCVLDPIHKSARIKRVNVSTYQSVSGAGREAILELERQTLGNKESKVFPHQIAFNCIPHIDLFEQNGYTKEEMKVINETKKIMRDPSIAVTCTAVRVPVRTGHSEAVNIETEKQLTVDEVRNILSKASGVVVIDEPLKSRYPTAVDSAGHDEVFVGRIRKDNSIKNGIDLWIVADNLRKGAATNAVQIAELLIK